VVLLGAHDVLVVDDDKETCANFSDIFTDMGYEVAVAYDPESALRIVGQNGHRLGLLDYKMPLMSGLDLFRQLRQIRQELICVLVSAFVSVDVAEAAMAEGFRAVLPKPVDFGKLMPIVQEVLGSA